MARLAPEESFDVLKDRVSGAVKDIFPIVGKKHTLRLDDINVNDNKDIEDLRSQKKARLDGRTWSVPVEAELSMVDNKTGKVLDQRKQRLMNLPKVTNRHSYIVDGQERQIENQWRLKPGVYSRRNDRGDLESSFHLKGRSAFKVFFDPESSKFTMKKGDTHIPLYPLMKEMGVSDNKLREQWGPKILEANQGADQDKALQRFYKATTKNPPKDATEARQFLAEFMDGAQMDPEVSEVTLGKPFSKVSGESVAMATTKLLGISRGTTKPDVRDSLMHKSFLSTEDFADEAVTKRSKEILRRIGNNLDRKSKVRDVVAPDVFNKPLKNLFTSPGHSIRPDQTNPLEMISGAMKTTIMGEGGIKSEHTITDDAKMIDQSHLGFLDPVHTPEGSRTGVTLHLPLGANKKGQTVAVKMYNVKTKKMEDVDPKKAYQSNVVLPDQVTWKDGKPIPNGKTVKFSGEDNEIEEGGMGKADYVMAAPAQLFSVSSNMVPFLQNNSGNRATYAGKQMEQAIPLKHREAPLVEPVISAGKKETGLNDFMGKINSHTAPFSGEVTKVKKDAIFVKGKDGKEKEVQIYDNFPLNSDKGFINSDPAVKVGDKVKKGQTIADTNFTKGGKLAIGTNLQAAYVPFHGYNFEDGVVVSETAAKKLTSEHMYRKGLDTNKEHTINKKKFLANFDNSLTTEQSEKLDDDGVVRKGQQIKPGDTLVAAMRKREETDESRVRRRMHKSLAQPYDNVSVQWEGDHPGTVTNVVKRGRRTEVHVRTDEPAEIGDKITGRHGNKGIITRIVPDHDMPKTKDDKRIEVALNPAGVPGRLNLGQVLETAAAKVAEKTGKPYRTQSFDGSKDKRKEVAEDLKKHGIEDKEELFDGKTGKSMGKALVGPHYMLKLEHQVGKKLVARAGGHGPQYAYDRNKMPKGGGPHGAQALDSLGVYAMLAHGATANMRDMQTYKSNADNNDQFWSAIQSGDPLPPPRPTFAYKRFGALLKTMGVNMEKQGNNINLMPLTDKQVKEMSNGEIKDAGRMLIGKNLKEEKTGLFDKDVTGGKDGTKWSHIKLPEPMPNPVFEKSILALTGLKQKELDGLMTGKTAIDPKTGKFTTPEKGISSGPAINSLLKKIDVDKELASSQAELKKPGLKDNRLDRVNKKVKYLRNLKKLGMTPTEAYMTKHVPVMPPSMRPMSALPDGTIINDDLNHMYKGLGISANKFRETSKLDLPEEYNKRRAAIYDGMKALSGVGGHMNRRYRGVLDIISGKTLDRDTKQKGGSPRESYFQSKLIKRKQDMSMRSTIIPEPELGLDQVGIPRKAAMEIYKPFVVRELRSIADTTPLKAQQMIKDKDPLATRALERVVHERPLLLKRDPVLHKYGVQAFKPILTSGKAVKIHPLVTSGYNADFDGDTMGAFVPVSHEAVQEAKKMYPSRNLFSPATGSLMYKPSHESQLGIYTLTQEGKSTGKTFKTMAEAAKAAQQGQVGMTDMVTIGKDRTSVGRALVAKTLPKQLRSDVLKGRVALDGKGQSELLTRVAKQHKNDYGDVANKLKDLGNLYATTNAVSIGLDDIKADKVEREKILSAADAKIKEIMQGKGTREQKEKLKVQVYDRASEQMIKVIDDKHGKKGSTIHTMMKAGVKPKMGAYRQITMAPMLMMNAKGETIPTPIRKSWSEGLDVGDYWTQMSGARKGVVQKVQSVQQPGYFTKQVINSVMNNSIGTDDCATGKGISLPVDERDILDRYLATGIRSGSKSFKAGTLVTPGVRDSLRNNKVRRVVVRSPLRCEHGDGICGKCYGLDEDGTNPTVGKNVGITSAQSIGERATQLSMRTFHEGGIAPVGKKGKQAAALTDEFNRVQQLTLMPKHVPGSAPLSTMTGKVTKVQKDPAGGHNVFINDRRHYIPQDRGEPMAYSGDKARKIKRGMQISKGSPLSAGPVNVNEMLPLTGVDKVQGYMAGQLYGLYKGEGIRRRNIETVVKSLTNLTQVNDPGDHKEYLRGDFVPTSKVQALNKSLASKKRRPVMHTPVLKGVKTLPLDMQTDWMARLNHESLNDTIIDAANQGWSSNIHGKHPIPGLAYGAEFGKGKPPRY
jgi:DNA-directed RNA polymerase subunit beta'